ncbi:P-loop containing nucleoside triphosphate hydrolase protein [Obelidium mucronatum]|nr:P-loop containing nucleoside triphosphate hydrolase protein [Obelidium mucronatum]
MQPETDLQQLELLKTDSEIVSESIREEEAKLAEQSEKEHQERLKAQNNAEFDEHIAAQRKSRLNFLITQAGTYSKWLASRLELRQNELVSTGRNGAAASAAAGAGDVAVAASDSDTAKKRKGRPAGNSSSSQPAKKTRANPGKELLNEASALVSNNSAASTTSATTTTAPAATAPATAGAPKIHHRQPALVTGCVMRDYQIVGMEWLISLWEQGLNGILADEMGLGKTLQTISFLAHLVEMNVWGPFLIVAPLSTLANWVSEIHRFTPSLKVVLYHGLATDRAHIRKTQMSIMNKSFPIVVTSFEIAMNDRRYLQKIKWKYIIVDEGHRLKNMNCRLIRELKTYPSANRLILSGTPLQNNLTELWSLLNFLMPDIFESITDFESWFDLDDIKDGDGTADSIADKESATSLVSNLHEILKPFLLRRIKTEVEVDLPKKRELLLFAPLVPKQKELYDACVGGISHFREYLIEKMDSNQKAAADSAALAADGEGNADNDDDHDEKVGKNGTQTPESEDSGGSGSRMRTRRSRNKEGYQEDVDDDTYFDMIEEKAENDATNSSKLVEPEKASSRKIVQNQKLQNLIMQLRKICNHPYLFDVPNEDAEKDFDFHTSQVVTTSAEGASKDEIAVRLPDIVACSGKMLMLERLLPELFKRGHKVLIFSQMTRMLDILADWFEFIKKWKFCRIDGNVTIETRREQIHSFNTDPDVRVFLLSTRSGGLGINLTSADTVIIYDSDWNPQMDLQAQDRVHRIGQTKPVIIYRLVTSGTVEKRILDRAASKRKLEKLVIHKSEFKGSSRYYKSNKKISDIEDLVSILAADEAESVTVSGVDPESTDGDMILMNRVISNDALEQILDRSPAAFNKKPVLKSNTSTAAGAGADGDESAIDSGKGGAVNSRFQEVEEERDESNDLLAQMTSK